jgi:hypothetical protein
MKQIRPEIKTTWLGTVDEGKQLELNYSSDDMLHQVALIFADEDSEELYVEVQCQNQLVQIPVRLLLEAIAEAQGEVHSEAWYEKNVYPNIEGDDA